MTPKAKARRRIYNAALLWDEVSDLAYYYVDQGTTEDAARWKRKKQRAWKKFVTAVREEVADVQ